MPKKNIYLASSYTNKLHMREIRYWLEKMGHKVVSEWLNEDHSPNAQIGDFTDLDLSNMSDRDIENIREADILVHFSSDNERGGAIAEFGISLGMRIEGRDMLTVLVGDRRNIFDYNYLVDYFPTEEAFLEWAEKEARR